MEAIYTFGDFRLDEAERLLYDGGTAVTLPPKVFDTLLMFMHHPGRVLSKEKMMSEIWDDSFVEENNLAQNISQLRRILREKAENKFIETVPKYGYRFVAEVAVSERRDARTEVFEAVRARVYFEDDRGKGSDSDSSTAVGERSPRSLQLPALTRATIPETHYAQNGEVNIAYQVMGDGPIDIVFVMGWVSHLEYFWKHHLFASFLERLASFSRLILFDKRGTGLSDRVPLSELPTLEQRMEDVHAVMDVVGSQSAVLVGVSEGGPMCSLFAATYPERTAGLVMIGTYAKRIRDDDYPWAPTEEQRAAFFELMQRDWGQPVGIEERAPSLANDEEFRDWWAAYLRMGASPGAAVALTKMNAEIDVREVLPSIRVPTLIIHRTGDKCLKVEEGRYVAAKIPGARFVEFPGDDHLPFVGNQSEILDEIERFVADREHAGAPDRVLATVVNLQTSEVDSARFDPSRDVVRRQLDLFKGRPLSYDSAGVMAAFDGPARAIKFARNIAVEAARAGIELRTGIHTGECDVVGDSYSGFAVELARQIAGLSSDGRILVSRTVKDLVAGSGLEFDELGRRSFNGIEGDWRLFTVRQ